MVLVTTPPHPASKARMMFASDSVGGAEESKNGFLNRMPVKTVERSAAIGFLLYREWMTIRQRVSVEKCLAPGGVSRLAALLSVVRCPLGAGGPDNGQRTTDNYRARLRTGVPASAATAACRRARYSAWILPSGEPSAS